MIVSSSACQRLAGGAARAVHHLRRSAYASHLSSPTSPISRRSFAKAAGKGKEKEVAKPTTTTTPVAAAPATTKPPHPSYRPLPPSLKVKPTPASASPLLTSLSLPSSSSSSSTLLSDPIFSLPDPDVLHNPQSLAAVADKYRWINWGRFADHLHRTDVHFFDQEVKWVDQNFDVKGDDAELRKVAALDEMEWKTEEENERLFQLLPFGAFIDQGSHTRVTRFGKVRSSWVLIIAGDQCGTASFGIGKGADAAEAVDRAERDLKNNITFLPLIESRTILYECIGKFGVCRVHMQPLPRGAGMTAGLVPRLVFDAFGIQDISAKVFGRSLPKHQVYAIWEGLSHQKSLRELSVARGVKLHRMFERGVEQPRSPPRWMMDDRAMEIGRKLKEVAVALEDDNEDDVETDVIKQDNTEEALEAERISFMTDEEKQAMLDRGEKTKDGRVMDTDDVMDGDEAEEMEEDEKHWGPWAIPGSYTPVLPPTRPHIPPPLPAEPTRLGRGRRINVGETKKKA